MGVSFGGQSHSREALHILWYCDYQLEANWMQLRLFKQEWDKRQGVRMTRYWVWLLQGTQRHHPVHFSLFFDFSPCKAAQKGYIATNFCQDVKMSQTRTSAVNAKYDLSLGLKLYEVPHCSVPSPAILFKGFRSIWNMLFIISLRFIIFISFLKHVSNEGVFRLAQVLAGLHILLVKIWMKWHDLLENKTKC